MAVAGEVERPERAGDRGCALPACSGSSTAPTERLVATAPTLVSITLPRTAAIIRRAMTSTPSVSQSSSTMPNLFEEKRPMQSLPRKARPMRRPAMVMTSSPTS
jgi:hypothetical protein